MAVTVTGTSVLTLTFVGPFATGASPGNLSYVGVVANHVAAAAVPANLGFTPQDIYTVSGF